MDNVQNELTYKFGLIGKNIDYSFSRGYFAEKFQAENLPHKYVNFDLEHISEIENIFQNSEAIKGLNVTIPYKEAIIPFLDKLNKRAKKIGAVNTIKINKKGTLIGYNTDYYGFKKSLKPYLSNNHKKALILGTGGASKAIAYALKQLKIKFHFVSRAKKENATFVYSELTEEIIKAHQILINCSPVGTYPNVNACPDIPYDAISEHHILYDLIYNPEQTKFLQLGASQNAVTINGLKMLELQAEKSWEIWNS
ncbi:shikimate dehydrogenase family protein [Winogradskyella haliclonae]|uniref:Shikimate 5-dehydrogenase n=1 Tax=Winogradskyella haliclonae TaxID=2048558 RepID=A0ABQ2BYZ0_9FLAO|nr:shikimate dehydrogenase [Winogradskyella haliclonae]GGI57140.1 shikimate 5-dehydrogenase [Winogradskyella haliclonae]